jgi:hypothetical protein
MSQNIKVQKVESEILYTEKEKIIAVLDGGSEITYRIYPSTSYSSNSIQFSIIPPNQNIFVNRRIYLQMTFNVTFSKSGTPVAFGNVVSPNGYLYGLRQYPLSSIIETLTATINNATCSIQLSDVVHEVQKLMNNAEERFFELGICPAAPDQFQNYQDGSILGTSRSPNTTWGTGFGDYAGRGSYRPDSVSTDTFTATYTVQEQIMLSPLIWGNMYSQGLLGINNLDFNFNLSSDLSRVFSGPLDVNLFDKITVTLSAAPQLLINYVTPSVLKGLPDSIPYGYNVVERFISSDPSPVQAGESRTINSNSITLNVIPDLILVYAKERKADLTYASTDTYGVATQIDLNWCNKSGLLASASSPQLWEFSRKNGLNQSYPGFSDFEGSVIVINPALQLGMTPTESDGSLGQWQLQLSYRFYNNTNTGGSVIGRPITYDLYITTITGGIFTIINDRAVNFCRQQQAAFLPHVEKDKQCYLLVTV